MDDCVFHISCFYEYDYLFLLLFGQLLLILLVFVLVVISLALSWVIILVVFYVVKCGFYWWHSFSIDFFFSLRFAFLDVCLLLNLHYNGWLFFVCLIYNIFFVIWTIFAGFVGFWVVECFCSMWCLLCFVFG